MSTSFPLLNYLQTMLANWSSGIQRCWFPCSLHRLLKNTIHHGVIWVSDDQSSTKLNCRMRPKISAQMSRKSHCKSKFQHKEDTNSPSGNTVGRYLTRSALHEARRLGTKRNFRTLSLSWIVVVGNLWVHSWHSSARWQNLLVTEGSRQLGKSFRIKNMMIY